jgi:hypothetical protein
MVLFLVSLDPCATLCDRPQQCSRTRWEINPVTFEMMLQLPILLLAGALALPSTTSPFNPLASADIGEHVRRSNLEIPQ